LPQTLRSSIEAKQQAEQEALAMNFRLQKEKQEAERKRIEPRWLWLAAGRTGCLSFLGSNLFEHPSRLTRARNSTSPC
jgi:hypothetical protein